MEIPASVVGDKLVAQISSFSFFQALGAAPLVVEPLPVQEIVVTFDSEGGQCSIASRPRCGMRDGTWTVPADVYTATFELYGASGGGLQGRGKGRGLGGKTTATLDVYPGEVLDIGLGSAGNTLASSGGGSGGTGGLFPLNSAAGDYFLTAGSAGGGGTDVVRGVRGVPKGWQGAHGRILVAGGGGGDAGVTAKHAISDGTFDPGNVWVVNAPGAPGGQGGGLVAGTGGSGQSGSFLPTPEGSSGGSWSAPTGGTGGSTLAPGRAGTSSIVIYDSEPGHPISSNPAADGSLLFGGGHGGDGRNGNSSRGVGGGGGGGGWMPGGGGSNWEPGSNAAGGGGGSSYGPDGSEFFQGVHSGEGKVIITFTPSPGRLPTTMTVTSSGTPSSAGQAVTLTATVTLKPPAVGPVTGSVRFEVDGQLLGNGPVVLVDGQATSDAATTLAPGLHSVVVIYLGNGNVGPSSATLAQVVTP